MRKCTLKYKDPNFIRLAKQLCYKKHSVVASQPKYFESKGTGLDAVIGTHANTDTVAKQNPHLVLRAHRKH